MIDEATFTEIKAAQDDGVSSFDVAEQMDLPLEDVNKVFAAAKLLDLSSVDWKLEQGRQERVSPARTGYYKGLIANKIEQNSNLKEERGWLLEQVYFLRKSIKFLEMRKRELEDGTKLLEKNIMIGVEAMEKLNANNNFTQISESVAKKNK